MPRKTRAELELEKDPAYVTLERARTRLGAQVLYQPSGRAVEDAELGSILYVGTSYVMVDYGTPEQPEPKATYPQDLHFVTAPSSREERYALRDLYSRERAAGETS